jgi:hypothetical protein
VVQGEELFCIVIAAIQRPLRTESRVHMARGAELAGIMAVAAIRFSGVGRCGMPREKSGRMIPGTGVGRVGPMAVETLRPHVAAFAGLGSGVRNRAVNLREILSVRRRSLALGAGALPSSRPRHR